jgi:hypothetical protein
MYECLIICNFGDVIDEHLLIHDINKYAKYCDKPYMVMDCKYIIPNFFNHIILLDGIKHKITDNDILTLFNMLYIGGVLTIIKKYSNLFKHFKVDIHACGKYICVKRLHNEIYNVVKNKRAIFDCIIMGVQKASTTSALINLLKHEDIGGHNDEIHFFDIYWSKGIDYLNKYMSKYDNKKIKLLKNPTLIYVNSTYPLIQSINPFVKLILFLRNPIDRAYSSWQMMYNNKWTHMSFEDSIEEELRHRMEEPKTFYTATFHYLRVGLYYKQIKKLLKWFPLQSIKIFVIERYEDHSVIYDEIYDFLNIKKNVNIVYSKERIGSYMHSISDDMKKRLYDFFKKDIKKIEKLLGYSTNWLK